MSKFNEAAASAKLDDDVQDVLSIAFASTPLQPKPPSNDSAPPSNRAAKRVSMNSRSPILIFRTFTKLTRAIPTVDRQV